MDYEATINIIEIIEKGGCSKAYIKACEHPLLFYLYYIINDLESNRIQIVTVVWYGSDGVVLIDFLKSYIIFID